MVKTLETANLWGVGKDRLKNNFIVAKSVKADYIRCMNKKPDFLTPKQRERQRHREAGKYAAVNPCYRCGKSAGVEYFSVLCDEIDSLGNGWDDIAICVCQKCSSYLEGLLEMNPTEAWADVTDPNYGKHPQGKPRK